MLQPLRQIAQLIYKDLLIDLRRKEYFFSMFLFCLLTLILFQFAMGEDQQALKPMVPGMMWVIFLLSGVLGLTKSFVQEADQGALQALLLTPTDRGVLFLGKMLSTTLFLLVVELLTLPLFVVLFDFHVQVNYLNLLAVLLAGTVGFSSLGTLLAAMTTTLKGREVLLPLLLFPLMIPNLISVVKITSHYMLSPETQLIAPWWNLLLAFDLIFVVASFLGFEFIMEE